VFFAIGKKEEISIKINLVNMKGQIIVTFYDDKKVLLTKKDTNVLKGSATIMIMAAHLSYILITYGSPLRFLKLVHKTGGGVWRPDIFLRIRIWSDKVCLHKENLLESKNKEGDFPKCLSIIGI
jgi:hypothetical protein